MASKLFDPMDAASNRRHAPATLRNRRPILQVLSRVFPREGLILEVASGTGEHGVFFGRRLPGLVWQPSDPDPELIASIDAWVGEAGLPNVRRAISLDATQDPWPVQHAEGIFCSNMIHIAPFEATEGLFRGASRILPPGGPLVLYGPFLEGGKHTSESNERFDAKLRSQNPAWGVRNLEEVIEIGARHGLMEEETTRMPANNLMVIFRKSEQEAK